MGLETFKETIKKLQEAEKAADALDEKLEAEPENEEVENEWDLAYGKVFKLYKKAAKELADITGTSQTIAEKMLRQEGEKILELLNK